jgi:hypothetical protein
MSKDESKQKTWFRPFGTGPTRQVANDATAAALAISPFLFLAGFLHRRWGAGQSEEHSKVVKNIPHTVAIGRAYKEANEQRTALGETIRFGLPLSAGVLMYMAGVKSADKHRRLTDDSRIKKGLAQAEAQYDEVLLSKLYPERYAALLEERARRQEPKPGLMGRLFPSRKAVEAPATEGPVETPVATKEASIGDWLADTGVMAPLGLGGLMIFGASFWGAKRWSDANSKQRAKADEIRKALELRAIKRWSPKLELNEPVIAGELAKEHEARIGLND